MQNSIHVLIFKIKVIFENLLAGVLKLEGPGLQPIE